MRRDRRCEAEAARDRRADLVGVEGLTLDGAGLDDVLGENPEGGGLPDVEAERSM
jgi:hypothetical protein